MPLIIPSVVVSISSPFICRHILDTPGLM